MTQFSRYPHLERYPHSELEGIEHGTCWVFPKLDGTNASVWIDEAGAIQCGSRNRVLSAGADNHGFHAWVNGDDPRAATMRALLLQVGPRYVVFGEWLVPHTIKGYRDDAWRRFWVFDVLDRETGRFVPYETYVSNTGWFHGVDVIEPLCTILNPSPEQLRPPTETNTYLMQDGAGLGEGVVVKNYEWANRYGRQPWAKFVRNEFGERNRREFGVTEKQGEFQPEIAIADECVTKALVDKERAKIVFLVANENGVDLTPKNYPVIEASYRGRIIPQLLGRVWHCVVNEELWQALKRHRNPTVDFRKLCRLVEQRTKRVAADLFGGVAQEVTT